MHYFRLLSRLLTCSSPRFERANSIFMLLNIASAPARVLSGKQIFIQLKVCIFMFVNVERQALS